MNKKILSISFIVSLIILINIISISANCPNGIVGYWNFDQNNTNQIDSSGNGNNGTVNGGASFIDSGKYGGAYSFGGVGSYVNVSHSNSLNISNEITLICWVKLNSYDQISNYANWHSSCIYKTGGPTALNVVGYGLEIYNGTGIPHFQIDDNNVINYVVSGSPLSLNEWHQLAGTYNGSDMKLYVDGVFINNISRSGMIDNSDYPLYIGSSRNEYANPDAYAYLNGTIDEVAVFNRALNQTEILNYNNSLLNYCEDTCTPNWQRGGWSSCSNKQKTRIFIDINNCNNPAGKPIETNSCSSGGGNHNNNNNFVDDSFFLQTLSKNNLNTGYNLDSLAINLTKVGVKSNDLQLSIWWISLILLLLLILIIILVLIFK
ncbi:MAG: LamG domain-containing protein [Nanoarchaeota archaeon]